MVGIRNVEGVDRKLTDQTKIRPKRQPGKACRLHDFKHIFIDSFRRTKFRSYHMQDIIDPHIGDKPVTRQRLNRDARRAQLLEHAISAFAEAGIERAAHADVAKRAKVSTPTVFKYFPTREMLVDAVLNEIEIAFWDLGGLKSNAIDLEPAQMAKSLANSMSELCKLRPDLMKVALIWSFAFSSVRERYQAFEKVRLDDLQPSFKSAGLTRADARIFLSSMFLYIRMHFDGTSIDSRIQYLDRVLEILETPKPSKR